MSEPERIPIPNIQAQWTISLDCECPKCDQFVDLLLAADFWDGRRLEFAEAKKGLEVECPECGHEFEVDCVW